MALTPAQQAQLADLALSLAHGSPETRRSLLATMKVEASKSKALAASLAPFIADTEKLVAAAPLVSDDAPDPKAKPATVGDIEAMLAADEGKRRKANSDAAETAARQRLIDEGRFTAETIKGLDAFMEESGYSSVEDAAILYAAKNPPASGRPQISSSRAWDMPSGDWAKDPKKTALNEAYKVVDELRGRRVA